MLYCYFTPTTFRHFLDKYHDPYALFVSQILDKETAVIKIGNDFRTLKETYKLTKKSI